LWAGLLGDTDFCDVAFKCDGGDTVPAHRVVLAAASPVVRTLFEGDWKENTGNAIEVTGCSASSIRNLLALVYTGELRGDPAELLALTARFMMEPLKQECEPRCIAQLDSGTADFKGTLYVAHRHSCAQLKARCFDFFRCHTEVLIFEPEVAAIAKEPEDLWKELQDYVKAQGAAVKAKKTG
jgi:speckle-type POZ protein